MMAQTIEMSQYLIFIMLSVHVLSSPVQKKPKIILKKLEMNILNGRPADIRNHPYSAFILAECSNTVFSCTGSLIFPYIVLTAGHCVDPCVNDPHYKLTATVGSSNINYGTKIKASNFILHEKYDGDTAENDVAMIFLSEYLKRSETLDFIKLAYSGFPDQKIASTAGWGLTEVDGTPSTKLLACTEYLKHYQKCEDLIYITENNFCTLLTENKCESLAGDSGGAVTTLDKKYQIGIVSYGDEEDTISVLVNVTHYLPWIHTQYEKVASRILFDNDKHKEEINATHLFFKSIHINKNRIPGMMKAVLSHKEEPAK